jgi:hypothetical protein
MLEELLYPLNNLDKTFTSIMIMLGLFVDGKLFWMVVYEYRWRGAGDDYLRYGKKFIQNKYMPKVSQSIYKKNEANRKNSLKNERN